MKITGLFNLDLNLKFKTDIKLTLAVNGKEAEV